MSSQSADRRMTIPAPRARKGGVAITMLTAHTAGMARLLDPDCDALPIGDSVGMVLHGLGTTRGVTPAMIALPRAAGAAAVTLEGGAQMAETIGFPTSRGAPVMGHAGLLPQSVNQPFAGEAHVFAPRLVEAALPAAPP